MKNSYHLIYLITLICSIYVTQAQTGIGTTTPDPSSVLDITATDKGLLTPRLDLTSVTQQIGASPNAEGLLVYNTGITLKDGYYFWDGSQWNLIGISNSAVPPSITSLDCSAPVLSPDSYTVGVPYSGVMYINYEGGNGASYPSGSAISSTGVTGLTATLSSGVLNTGSGVLSYVVSGTPSASSPEIASFTLPTTFGGSGCTANVGDAKFITGETRGFRTVIDAASFTANGGSRTLMNGKNVTNVTTTNRRSAYEFATNQSDFIVVNGLRLDFIEWTTNGLVSPKFFNTTSNAITYSISSLSTGNAYLNGANTTIASNAYSYFIDGNDGFSCDTNNSEYLNAMLTFPNGEWYQVTFHATRDATNYYFYMTVLRLK